ncbi:hypothetical protein BHF71_07560 [Vulcanibacillus modesticaldus]|uniref:ABC transporter domain-containing protein n=1 Tax=Vulcanibacillus modesticaldus TaxID=337097 RepID=A0A1D2YVP6_9BACI|nr:dipeptide ABC transporter ATP-binding protein [Vulcanibacillus modesticaldus]OEF99741.1 hypothetical protein BHF71_07560 [Vulcanibacillus modesticaldus]
MKQTVLVEVKNLKKYFPIKGGILKRTIGHIKAVDDVSFTMYKGETLGIVGESGSGKSTMGRTMIRLYEPTEGEVFFEGDNLFKYSRKEMRRVRKGMQMVFQDPFASLNPRMTIAELIEEPMVVHKLYDRSERNEKVKELLNKVGLQAEYGSLYPHEFSGGQRQRVGLARALSINPKLIIADEPVSALDVSVQAQVINLMKDLQDEFELTYLFIAHDLSVVKHLSDRVGVMYLGRLVELANKKDLYSGPVHPYTQALLSAVPVPNPRLKKERIILEGDIPSPANPPSGCVFHPRCKYATDRCRVEKPLWREIAKDHYVACHLVD